MTFVEAVLLTPATLGGADVAREPAWGGSLGCSELAAFADSGQSGCQR